MRWVVIGWVLGAVLGTIAWFTLSPLLTDRQEHIVQWLLDGTGVVLFVAVVLHASRRAHQRTSS